MFSHKLLIDGVKLLLVASRPPIEGNAKKEIVLYYAKTVEAFACDNNGRFVPVPEIHSLLLSWSWSFT